MHVIEGAMWDCSYEELKMVRGRGVGGGECFVSR